MSKWLARLGYTGAGLTLAAAALTPFLLYGLFMKIFAATGVTIDPVYSGGAVRQRVDRGAYHINLHHPVQSSAMLGRSARFVQVTWTPDARLAAHVSDTLDLDGDGTPDATFTLDTGPQLRLDIIARSPAVRSGAIVGTPEMTRLVTRVGDQIIARVPLAARR